ncbi:zinc-binding dehydrogenase [[Mycobacterium] wendilense]|uniref:zinc-dependent alcohol dehydrogenase n=1 Tax=[Mycobacterium] wendilense TaxID=3064284 RepID=UPI0037CBC339
MSAPGQVDIVDIPTPSVSAGDVLVRIRACGICGSDTFYLSIGGLPPHQGNMPLGHEAAGEVVAVGSAVTDIAVGQRVVINPMAAPDGVIGNGGASGALAQYLLIKDAVVGHSVEPIPDHVPFEVAALNEPMAVARHGVNQVAPKLTDQVVVFGAGPIGLGMTISLKSLGVHHVVVVDVVADRLDKALEVGADAVINSSTEDLPARLRELHGNGESIWPDRAGTDIYLDAAGVPAVVNTALSTAKRGAKIGIVGVHKEPVSVDLMNIMSNELTLVGSMGYPTEIFEVTPDIVADWQTYAKIISHTIDFDDLPEALELVATPGATEKVVIVFD